MTEDEASLCIVSTDCKNPKQNVKVKFQNVLLQSI